MFRRGTSIGFVVTLAMIFVNPVIGSASASSIHGSPSATYRGVIDTHRVVGFPNIPLTTHATAPHILNFVASPSSLPVGGGKIELSAGVKDGVECTLSSNRSVASLPNRAKCISGSKKITVQLPKNTSKSTRVYKFELFVTGATIKTNVDSFVSVKEAAKKVKPATAPSSSSTHAPTITAQPANDSVVAGNAASFTAAASGTPSPSEQWQVSNNGGGTWTTVSGATSSTYSFTASSSQNGYEYEAVFANTVGSATTDAATLTVATVPSVTAQPPNASVISGSTASFTASASGSPTPSVQWQQSTDGGGTWTTVSGATSSTYSFTASSSQNGYEYEAVFTNTAGSVTTNAATLTVTSLPMGGGGGGSGTSPPPPPPPPPSQVAPSITTQPPAQAVAIGATATFTATASGTPAPTAQWQFSSNQGVTWTVIAGATSATYSRTALSTDNGYEYQAVFTNVQGSASTNPAELTVDGAPTITTQPTNESVTSGLAASFMAGASSTTSTSLQWQFSSNHGVTWTVIAGATSQTYSFTPSFTQNRYEYQAIFTNTVASTTTQAATLTISQASTNWSGYVDTGSKFSAVRGQWTVPSVTCSPNVTSYSSQWIGIDGYNSQTVEQDGTEADCLNGTPEYYPWYEMYGDSSVNGGFEVRLLPTYPASPGDSMNASVSVSNGIWTLAITDSTSGWQFSTSVTFSSPTQSSPDQSSAEWVVETPQICSNSGQNCTLGSLADFGSVTISGASATLAGTPGPISAFAHVAIEMENGSDPLALPGILTTSGGQFTDTWQASS